MRRGKWRLSTTVAFLLLLLGHAYGQEAQCTHEDCTDVASLLRFLKPAEKKDRLDSDHLAAAVTTTFKKFRRAPIPSDIDVRLDLLQQNMALHPSLRHLVKFLDSESKKTAKQLQRQGFDLGPGGMNVNSLKEFTQKVPAETVPMWNNTSSDGLHGRRVDAQALAGTKLAITLEAAYLSWWKLWRAPDQDNLGEFDFIEAPPTGWKGTDDDYDSLLAKIKKLFKRLAEATGYPAIQAAIDDYKDDGWVTPTVAPR